MGQRPLDSANTGPVPRPIPGTEFKRTVHWVRCDFVRPSAGEGIVGAYWFGYATVLFWGRGVWDLWGERSCAEHAWGICLLRRVALGGAGQRWPCGHGSGSLPPWALSRPATSKWRVQGATCVIEGTQM
jgi:hypothetical protein